MSGVRQVTVGPEDADQRLDRWLRRLHPHVPQGHIERMCRKGEIRIDGARARAATRLAAGQTVRELRIAEVIRQDVTIEDGRVSGFRVRLGISFKYSKE